MSMFCAKLDQKLKAFLKDGNESTQQESANWWANYPHKILIRGHPLSTYAKFSKEHTCAYLGVRNVNFSETFA